MKERKYTKAEYTEMARLKIFYFHQIKKAEEDLKALREKCDHPETELCTYSTRPGQYWENTEICSICGDVVNFPFDNWRFKPKEDEENILERDGSHVHIKTDDKKLRTDFKTSGDK
jgi:hypothetical protein